MKIYNAGSILTGLVIFLGLVTFPFWYGLGSAAPSSEPRLDTPAIAQLPEKQCVEDTAVMRSSHMKLLEEWRTEVVREGKSFYLAENGKKYQMSLQNTCMKCHSSKAQFCDQCHNYVRAQADCWTCHVAPREAR